MKNKPFLIILLALAVLGMIDSIHLIDIKYDSKARFCDMSETFSCNLVNQSVHSEVLGVPVAAIGLAGYTAMAVVILLLLNQGWIEDNTPFEKMFNNAVTPLSLMILVFIGLGAQIYFTLIEIFVLEAYCIFCLLSQLILLIMSAIALTVFLKKRKMES